MIVHHEPKVYLVGRPQVMSEGLEQFLNDHQISGWSTDTDCDGQRLCEVAGRLCYLSFARPRPGGNQAYLRHILEVGHGSVIEHSSWNFIITGISRSCSHELVRHRAGWAYSMLSQRYVDESVAEYVCPDAIANDPEMYQIWLTSIERSHAAYCMLADRLHSRILQREYHESCARVADSLNYPEGPAPLEVWLKTVPKDRQTAWRKEARQAARSVLPNATETKIFCTANARAVRHFLELRGSRHAEPEIRKVANKLLALMQQEAPNIFSDYTTQPLPDGTYEITTAHRKV